MLPLTSSSTTPHPLDPLRKGRPGDDCYVGTRPSPRSSETRPMRRSKRSSRLVLTASCLILVLTLTSSPAPAQSTPVVTGAVQVTANPERFVLTPRLRSPGTLERANSSPPRPMSVETVVAPCTCRSMTGEAGSREATRWSSPSPTAPSAPNGAPTSTSSSTLKAPSTCPWIRLWRYGRG